MLIKQTAIFFIILLTQFLSIQSRRNIRSLVDQLCQGISIDAGSSGNRIYIHSWKCTQYSKQINIDNALQVKCPNTSCRSQKLADFAGNINLMQAYFTQVFTWINSQVQESRRKITPIILGATAGMRLVSQSNQDAIINEAIRIFATSGYLFPRDPKIQKEWCKVITGQQEGAFLWLSVNLLLNTLKASNYNNKKAVATIDIGGASSQIAFIPQDNEELDKSINHNYDVVIKRLNFWHLYTVSYLNYGADEARKRILGLFKVQGVEDRVTSPCFPQGYDSQNICDTCAPFQESVITENNVRTSMFVSGQPDLQKCMEKTLYYIQGKTKCTYDNPKKCAVLGNYQSLIPESTEIHAVSNVYFTALFLGIEVQNGKASFTLKEYFDRLKAMYQKNWDYYKQKFISQAGDNYQYCRNSLFSSTYTYLLLLNGYNISENQIITIHKDIGWDSTNLMQKLSHLKCEQISDQCFPSTYNYERNN